MPSLVAQLALMRADSHCADKGFWSPSGNALCQESIIHFACNRPPFSLTPILPFSAWSPCGLCFPKLLQRRTGRKLKNAEIGERCLRLQCGVLHCRMEAQLPLPRRLWYLCSLAKDRTPIPYFGRDPGPLNHWTAREVLVTQSCLILWEPLDCIPSGSSVHGIQYWSGLSFPSPGDLPDPGIKPRFPALQADSLLSEAGSQFPRQ